MKKRENSIFKKFQKIVLNVGVRKNLLIEISVLLFLSLLVLLFLLFILQSKLTFSYRQQKINQQSFSYWIENVEKFPNSPDVLYNAAVAAFRIDKKETALKLLKKAIEKDPLFEKAKQLQAQILKSTK